jgi:acetylornithine/succinyldiaminopimelate/putrescine aminotransferase
MRSQRQFFLNHIAQTTPNPLMLEIESAQGVFLYGKNGEKYIDFISGISVSNVGHCHPKVVEAIQNQSSKFMHLMVYGEYIYTPQNKLAEALLNILPESLNSFYFTNSGTEATEGALKLAKRATGRYEIASFKNAYHGSTAGALSIMGSETYKQAFRPLIPNHLMLHFNDINEIQKITDKTAAVVVEMVQAEAGIIKADLIFLQKLAEKCKKVGALLIVDEIQTGFGRTGLMFAFEHYGIIPDILLIGKGFGGGMPIAAFIANQDLMKALSSNPILGHISTFAANPVCCAAALASLEVILEEKLHLLAEEKGKLLESKLEKIVDKPIRRAGLMLSIQHETMEDNFSYCNFGIEHGVIIDWFLFNEKATRIGPPLIISEQEMDWAIARLTR